MLRFDCPHCHENVFVVQDADHLGAIPHQWKCSGCGRIYRADANDDGLMIVYPYGDRKHAQVYDVKIREPKKTRKSKAANKAKTKKEKKPEPVASPEPEPTVPGTAADTTIIDTAPTTGGGIE